MVTLEPLELTRRAEAPGPLVTILASPLSTVLNTAKLNYTLNRVFSYTMFRAYTCYQHSPNYQLNLRNQQALVNKPTNPFASATLYLILLLFQENISRWPLVSHLLVKFSRELKFEF